MRFHRVLREQLDLCVEGPQGQHVGDDKPQEVPDGPLDQEVEFPLVALRQMAVVVQVAQHPPQPHLGDGQRPLEQNPHRDPQEDQVASKTDFYRVGLGGRGHELGYGVVAFVRQA